MCTDFLLTAKCGGLVNGRSMEFGIELDSKPLVRRRGEVMRSRTPDETPERNGLQWTVKYGYLGMNVRELELVVDGLNECGLSVGTLWLPGSKYQEVTDSSRALSVLLVNDWLLGTCASVADVEATLPTVEVWAYEPMEEKLSPIHFTVHDTSGNSIVIEYTAGKLCIYDNKIATTTNAPVFPWHLENVRNYVGLTPYDVNEATVNGKEFMATGNGTGLRGLPGDFTPPSRLIRTLFLINSALQRRTRARREISRCTFSMTQTFPRALCATRTLSATRPATTARSGSWSRT
jgi:choloylglycine hydrolase